MSSVGIRLLKIAAVALVMALVVFGLGVWLQLGLLKLARRYSKSRLEKACERALAIRSINYQSIVSILKQGLDQQPLEGDAHLQDDLPLHDNVRGADYYH